jgi:hypothetical protein
MAGGSELPKRGRGRPRMPEEEKKRHNMTFRLRSDLRAAIEEMAQGNGRSLSEQLEYYVEAGFRDEAKMLYQYSTGGLTPAVSAFLNGREVWKDSSYLPVKFTETVPAASRVAVGGGRQQTSEPTVPLAWAQDPAEHEGALHLARALLDGTVRGALQSFEEILGPHIVAALQADSAISLNSINIKTNRTLRETEDRCTKAEAEVERLRTEIEAFKVRAPGVMPPSGEAEIDPLSIELIEAEFARLLGRQLPKHDGSRRTLTSAEIDKLRGMFGTAVDDPEVLTTPSVAARSQVRHGGFSIPALRDLVARFTDPEPDLEALRAAGWPVRFGDLAAGTRTTLIGELREGASDVYQTLMSPTAPHSEAVTALRRLQGVLLPRVNEDNGADEDFGAVEQRGTRARR